MPALAENQEEIKLDRLNSMITDKINCPDLIENLTDFRIIIEKTKKIYHSKRLEIKEIEDIIRKD